MTEVLTAETIKTFDAAVASLLRIKWSTEKIARQLSSKDSYGKDGITYTWALNRISQPA